MEGNEANLLQRARAGDGRAFARLVELYWPRMHRWLFALTHHEQTAEDLTQETFLRAYKALASLKDSQRFRAWLFSIARHCLQDSQRGPRGRGAFELPADLAGHSPAPLEELVGQETCERIQEEFAQLPLLYRSALLLWTQEQMPYDEMAQALGTTAETARWRVCKARQLLQTRLRSVLEREVP